MKKCTDVYTDGSCLGNPGPGGWAVVFDDRSAMEITGHSPATTNNRMELTAILEALRATDGEVCIYTDSLYAMNVSTGKWLARDNRDLVSAIHEALDGRNVYFEWVRGHSDNTLNERANELAQESAISQT